MPSVMAQDSASRAARIALEYVLRTIWRCASFSQCCGVASIIVRRHCCRSYDFHDL